MGSAPSALSIVSVTSARPSGARPDVPAKMTSSILPPRRAFAPCSPSTQLMASTTLDFPEPFGPTTQVMPGSRRSVVAEAKDLKPFSVRLLRCTGRLRGGSRCRERTGRGRRSGGCWRAPAVASGGRVVSSQGGRRRRYRGCIGGGGQRSEGAARAARSRPELFSALLSLGEAPQAAARVAPALDDLVHPARCVGSPKGVEQLLARTTTTLRNYRHTTVGQVARLADQAEL